MKAYIIIFLLYITSANAISCDKNIIQGHALICFDVFSNEMSTLNSTVFENFESVRKLILSSNRIKLLEGDTFAGLTDLEVINLTNNEIEELPEEIFDKNLNLLDISLMENDIVDVKQGTFTNLVNLTSVDLSFNKIESLPKGLFKYNANLKVIKLRENKIKELQIGLFNGLSRLHKIDLAYNEIEDLPPHLFMYNYNMKEIILRGNQVKFLDYSVTHLNVKMFDVSNNPLDLENEEVKETLHALHKSGVKTHLKHNKHHNENKVVYEMPAYLKYVIIIMTIVIVLLVVGVVGFIYMVCSNKQKKLLLRYFITTRSKECLVIEDNSEVDMASNPYVKSNEGLKMEEMGTACENGSVTLMQQNRISNV